MGVAVAEEAEEAADCPAQPAAEEEAAEEEAGARTWLRHLR